MKGVLMLTVFDVLPWTLCILSNCSMTAYNAHVLFSSRKHVCVSHFVDVCAILTNQLFANWLSDGSWRQLSCIPPCQYFVKTRSIRSVVIFTPLPDAKSDNLPDEFDK